MDDLNQEIPLNYELTFLVKEENSSFLKEELAKIGANLLNERQLQKIKLAYPIKKEAYGFLGAVVFTLSPAAVAGLEAALKLRPQILRYSLSHAIMNADKTVPEVGAYNKIREERKRPIFVREPVKNFEPVLTNEALEKKIDELK